LTTIFQNEVTREHRNYDAERWWGYVDEEQIIQLAKTILLETGYFEPTVFIKGSTGKLAVQPEKFGETADDRRMKMLNMGTYVAYKQNVGELIKLIFVDEAWVSPARKEQNVLPSKDPDRIETLIINSLDTSSQEETMICFEMMRDPKGKLIDLKKMSLPGGTSVKGMLLPAFQKGYQIVRPTAN
jgi:hypothetical protein